MTCRAPLSFDRRRVFRMALRRAGSGLLAALALAASLPLCAQAAPQAQAAPPPLTVFAAASLKTALDEIGGAWTAATGGRLAISYAGSSALARQIEQGAPADLFLSANAAWMDRLETAGLIRADTRRDVAGNALVLIAHDPAAPKADLAAGFDLAGRLEGGRLAMALVDAVPAGIYGKQALGALGLWEGVAPHLAQADNVRAALALVATGEAPYGIVYATDATPEPRVTVVGAFPAASHDPIVYPAAATAESDAPDAAAAFLDFLAGPEARAALTRQGFSIPD